MLVILKVRQLYYIIIVLNIKILLSSSEFFEDCVAEASYEAQKLDIMRDAVRARVSYSKAREDSVSDQN